MKNNLTNIVEKRIRESYDRRKNIASEKYDVLTPDVYLRRQELERTIIKWLNWKKFIDRSNKKILEIGCGSGTNLLLFVQLGFDPKNLVGNELLAERLIYAKTILPGEIKIIEGDAYKLSFPSNYFDVVFQSTVFSSLLDQNYKKALAERLWSFISVGGGILWYDFIYNNPQNKDVRGVRLAEIRRLFPDGKIKYWRITLAPPMSRFVTSIHPNLYHVFNFFPFLRTHILCWIEKP